MFIYTAVVALPLFFGLGLCPLYLLTFDYSITYTDALAAMTLVVWITLVGALYILFGKTKPRRPDYLARMLVAVGLQFHLWVWLRVCQRTYPLTGVQWFALVTGVACIQVTLWTLSLFSPPSDGPPAHT